MGGGAEPCFLVRYKMKRGPESVGFVGPLTWGVLDLPLAEIERIPARWRMRRMLNLYIGWYLAFTASQGDAKVPLTPKQLARVVPRAQGLSLQIARAGIRGRDVGTLLGPFQTARLGRPAYTD